MLEFIERITALDVLFLLLWIGATVYGFMTGIVRQMFIIGAMLIGLVLGFALAPPLSVWTGPISGVGREAILPFTYTVLVFLIALLIYILIIRTYPHTRFRNARIIDTLGGGIAGYIAGLVGITALVGIIEMLTRGQWAMLDGARASVHSQLQTGPLVPWIAGTFPLVFEGIARLIPGG